MDLQKLSLLNAVLFTLCALVWLVNGVLQVMIGADGFAQLAMIIGCVLLWTAGAVFWWSHWRKQRQTDGSN